ncbi:Polynucleotide 5'-hydroxyl-kinase grc3 [Zancudomyces culisetae]|uniref:Polynucleotide 5'-hydroxyl-kinase GRC3 n=1 Tax=Zancudomyces culisetae TaxID=1213189 RepID=A0A1R1PMI7_ZANCU|nr:Polynucleotide 5'-hydroxyl-kinase grc3 [Zancudomyces culisetae]|eukprot:OMH82178.1 Polynucleotide 5'-hydroxyl-kinase grc3 [Zancudomyces culisetae]
MKDIFTRYKVVQQVLPNANRKGNTGTTLIVSNRWKQVANSLIDSISSGKDNKVIMVSGQKSTGKSTFARYLRNLIASAGYGGIGSDQAVDLYWMETDLGQPEYSLPGLVGLYKIRSISDNTSTSDVASKPKNVTLTHPPFTQLYDHNVAGREGGCTSNNEADMEYSEVRLVKGVFIGAQTPRDQPNYYINSIEHVMNAYNELVKKSDNSNSESNSEFTSDDNENTQNKKKKQVLIVNTHGWVRGLGSELMVDMLDIIQPTESIHLELSNTSTGKHDANINININSSSNSNSNSGGGGGSTKSLGGTKHIYVPSCTLSTENSFGNPHNFEKQRLKTLGMLLYFNYFYEDSKNFNGTESQKMASIEVDFKNVKLYLANCGVLKSNSLKCVDSSIVGITLIGDSDTSNETGSNSADTKPDNGKKREQEMENKQRKIISIHRGFPDIRKHGTLRGYGQKYICHGIVKCIDSKINKMYLSVPQSQYHTIANAIANSENNTGNKSTGRIGIVKSTGLQIPIQMTNFNVGFSINSNTCRYAIMNMNIGLGNPQEGLINVEYSGVENNQLVLPYLAIGNTEGIGNTVSKIRKNLQRKSHIVSN